METKWTAVERRRRYVGNSADMRHAGWTRLGLVNTAELQNMTAYLTSIVFTSGRRLARSEVLSGVGSWTKRFPFTWKRKKRGGQRERPTGEASRGRDALAGRPRPQEKTDSSRPAFYRSSRRGTKSLSVIRELYAWLLSCSHDAPGLAKGCRPGVWANGKQADTCCKPRQ